MVDDSYADKRVGVVAEVVVEVGVGVGVEVESIGIYLLKGDKHGKSIESWKQRGRMMSPEKGR